MFDHIKAHATLQGLSCLACSWLVSEPVDAPEGVKTTHLFDQIFLFLAERIGKVNMASYWSSGGFHWRRKNSRDFFDCRVPPLFTHSQTVFQLIKFKGKKMSNIFLCFYFSDCTVARLRPNSSDEGDAVFRSEVPMRFVRRSWVDFSSTEKLRQMWPIVWKESCTKQKNKLMIVLRWCLLYLIFHSNFIKQRSYHIDSQHLIVLAILNGF